MANIVSIAGRSKYKAIGFVVLLLAVAVTAGFFINRIINHGVNVTSTEMYGYMQQYDGASGVGTFVQIADKEYQKSS